MFLDMPSTVTSELLTQSWIVQQTLNRFRKTDRVARRHRESTDAVLYKLSDSRDPGGNNRYPRSKRFHQHYRHTLSKT